MSDNFPIFDELYTKYPEMMYRRVFQNGEYQILPGIIFVEEPLTGNLVLHTPVGSPFQESPTLKADLEATAARYNLPVLHRTANKHRRQGNQGHHGGQENQGQHKGQGKE